MRILSEKQYQEAIDQAKGEVKGYYQQREGDANEYIKALASQVRGQLQLSPYSIPTRQQIAKMYETNAVLKGIVGYGARCVGEVLRFLELRDIKTGEVDEKHWLNAVLVKPNDRFTLRAYGEAAYTNYALFGDQWNYAPKQVGVKKGEVKELYCIPSQKVGVKAGKGESLFDGVSLAHYGVNKTIATSDVFEVFDYNIDDTTFFGSSKVVAAAVYLSVQQKGMERQNTSLENGGAASIITPTDSQYPALKEEKDSAEQELNAHRNANKNVFMRMPVQVHQLGNNPVDLSILNSHKEAVTALCFVYNFPVDLYYGQSKYENAYEAKKQVYDQTAIPFAEKWAEALLNYLNLSDKYELVVNRDRIELFNDNPYSIANSMNTCGAFTTNEIREAAGWERLPDKWADEVRLPFSVQIGNEPVDISEF